MQEKYSEITPEIIKLAELCKESNHIHPELYTKYEVKRGLRDISGKGVLAGLTEISEVRSYTLIDSDVVPCEGELYYRGVNVENIVNGFIQEEGTSSEIYVPSFKNEGVKSIDS